MVQFYSWFSSHPNNLRHPTGRRVPVLFSLSAPPGRVLICVRRSQFAMTSQKASSSRLPRVTDGIPSVWSHIVDAHYVAATGKVRDGSCHHDQIASGEQGIAANLRLAAVRFIVFHRRLLWLCHPPQVAGFNRSAQTSRIWSLGFLRSAGSIHHISRILRQHLSRRAPCEPRATLSVARKPYYGRDAKPCGRAEFQ